MRCPSCKKEFQREHSEYAPFCSERCKLLDLGRWLDESYRIPGEPAPIPEGYEDVHDPDDGSEKT